jgi:hypothetical protein
MKTLFTLVLLVVSATAQEGNNQFVSILSPQLTKHFLASKRCNGLTVFDRSTAKNWGQEIPGWFLAVVGDGRGKYQVWLSQTEAHRFAWFGTNEKKGVAAACEIMTGASTNVRWVFQ